MDIDALESFIKHFRMALREHWRAGRGEIPRKGGRPAGDEAAATALRLVEFRTGSGIATLEPALGNVGTDEPLAFGAWDETLALTTLRQLLDDVETDAGLPAPVVEALGSARKAIGDDGYFGVALDGESSSPRRVVIDQECMQRLQRPEQESAERALTVIGRLHMIEADPPSRRVAVRAQDNIDWTCTYPDHLHPLVLTLIERVVRVTGKGRRTSALTGRLHIERLDLIPEHATDPLFTDAPVPLDQLQADQHIVRPQGLAALVDDEWEDDEAGQQFLEATLSE